MGGYTLPEVKRQRYRAANPLHERTCKRCKKVFIPSKRIDQAFCSKTCIDVSFKRRKRFDGNRDAAMARDGYQCRLCGKREQLVVHHIDGTGETSSPNHGVENLAVLCRACHMAVHRLDYRLVNGTMVITSPVYKLTGLVPVVFEGQLLRVEEPVNG